MKPEKFSLGDILRKLDGERNAEGAGAPPPGATSASSMPSDAEPALPERDARTSAHPAHGGRPAAKHGDPHPRSSFNTTETEEETDFDIFRYIGILLQRRKTVAIVTLVVALVSVFQYLRADRLYTTHARLLFKPEEKEIVTNGDPAYRDAGNRANAFNTHLELLRSKTVLSIVSDNLDNKVRPEQIGRLLTIQQGQTNREKNDIIELSYQNSNPVLARDVLNELCKTYIDYRLEVNSQEITKLIRKLEVQIDKFQTELDQKESDLRKFKEENRMADLSDATNLTVSKLSEMELELQKTQLGLVESDDKYTALTSQIGKQDQDVVQSVTYTDPILDKLAELELEYNTLLADNSQEHYKVKLIRDQIDRLKAAVADSITREAASKTLVKNPIRQSLVQELVTQNIERSSLEAKRIALEKVIEKLNGDLLKLPSVEQRYAFLQRETESLLQTLRTLKGKYEEAQIRRDAQETDIKILELADLPASAVPSVKFVTVLLGILIGFILGIAAALLLERLDQSVKDPSTLEKQLGLPLLGIVPMIDTNKALIQKMSDLEKTVLEPFRSLRANLKHLAAAHRYKVFMICSAIKGEGKTTLAANLAITFAVDGKKTILVDADLRRSQMHTLFTIPKETGLTDYLLGMKSVDEVLKKVGVIDNLSVITAGERPHNPAELVGTFRFDLLVKELRERADIVIFDTPALLPVSDAITMAPKMDGCVMVCRTTWTPLKAARQAKYLIARIGCHILGGILNGVSLSRNYYPYYYGYYGYYSYSKYTYEDEKRRRLSIREVGLRIEESFKKGIRLLAYSLPKYSAAPRSFLRQVGRKKIFWILLALLCAGYIGESWLAGKPPRRHHPATGIDYLGINGGGISGGEGTRPAAGSTLPAARIDHGKETAARLTAMQQVLDGQETIFPGIRDGIRRWFEACSNNDLAAYLSLYDSIEFHFSGGGFIEWREKSRVFFAQNIDKTFILDSIRPGASRPSISEVVAYMSMLGGADTARMVNVFSWKQGNDGWKIVGERAERASRL